MGRSFALVFALALLATSACKEEASGDPTAIGPGGGADGGAAATCPNGRVDPWEDCDGPVPPEKDCFSVGYQSGSLLCGGECRFDTVQCVRLETCGNGALDISEFCEGFELRDQTCESQGFTAGALRCTADCTYDKSGCTYCGDGVREGAEICDGDCPADCDDAQTCTADTLAGSPGTCDAVCSHTDIDACGLADACCPGGCAHPADPDCPFCGDGKLDEGELCDGDCPETCEDQDPCTTDTRTGAPEDCDVVCGHDPVSACLGGDGCCAPGCTDADDDDCEPLCNNGTLDPGETCDRDCPQSCDDHDACTIDRQTGSPSTCDIDCRRERIEACANGDQCCPAGCTDANDADCADLCGDGQRQAWEACDGDYPLRCSAPPVCTTVRQTGDAAHSNVECAQTPIRACQNGDGCCPGGCNGFEDHDCPRPQDIGGPCANDDECGGFPPYVCQVVWPGGYCTKLCESQDDCPADSRCTNTYTETPQCLRTCDGPEDCRPGYWCWVFNICEPEQ